jgi:hypothetical protein
MVDLWAAVAWKRAELDGPFTTKRQRIHTCWACLNIYAPLAEKAGMSLIKNEMEDMAFQFLMPQEYGRIASELKAREDKDLEVLKQARAEVQRVRTLDGADMGQWKRLYDFRLSSHCRLSSRMRCSSTTSRAWR